VSGPVPGTPGPSRRQWWQDSLVGRPGILAAFLWGLAEATFFFVIPDVLLSFVAILAWPRTSKHVLAAIAGALLGGALLFHWASVDSAGARAAVTHVPFVREKMFLKVSGGFRRQGWRSMLLGSFSGIPYKLYAVEAPKFTSPLEFLLVTPPARAVRFLLVWAGFGTAASWLRKRRAWPFSRLVKIHAALWIASYAFYWGRILFG
jgi:membrane protein YqaA with SNARE-associated domain